MVEISNDEFEGMVADEYDGLPPEMVKGIENVEILIADQPAGESPRLFGLYSGRPLTSRSVYGYGELPDRITLFRNNMRDYTSDLDQLRARVRITLVHEIGHYFGLNDARLHELGWD
jgi:predicted Zn-dependent protease with MMP-like domain